MSKSQFFRTLFALLLLLLLAVTVSVAQPDPNGDADGDGVPNGQDACPLRGDEGYGVQPNGCPTPPPPPDSDGDGFPDGQDNCPGVPGPDQGCPPDSDGDGFRDPADQCPQVPGPDQGCPPDSDGDGFRDPVDQCPQVPGPDQGCPPDSDGDGFRDPVDQCPLVPGPNQGCPEPTATSGRQPVLEVTATPMVTATPERARDRDRDDILDEEDSCPRFAGPASNNGCPLDNDGDGIPNALDRCPEVPGTRQGQGCPSDTDQDGVPDSLDECVNIAGTRDNQGCPPDSDGDGIPDDTDVCPEEAGTPAFQGCTEDTGSYCYVVSGIVSHENLTEPLTGRYRIIDPATGSAVSEIAHVTFSQGDTTQFTLYLQSAQPKQEQVALGTDLPDGVKTITSDVYYTIAPGACDAADQIDSTFLNPLDGLSTCYVVSVEANATNLDSATASFVVLADGRAVTDPVDLTLSGSGTGTFTFYVPGTEIADAPLSLLSNIPQLRDSQDLKISPASIEAQDITACDGVPSVTNFYLNPDEVDTVCTYAKINATISENTDVSATITDSVTGQVMFDGTVTFIYFSGQGSTETWRSFNMLPDSEPVFTSGPAAGVTINSVSFETTDSSHCSTLYKDLTPQAVCAFDATERDPELSVSVSQSVTDAQIEGGSTAVTGSWVSQTIQGEEVCYESQPGTIYGEWIDVPVACPEPNTSSFFNFTITSDLSDTGDGGGFTMCPVENGDEVACSNPDDYYCVETSGGRTEYYRCDPPPPPACAASSSTPANLTVSNQLDHSLTAYWVDENCSERQMGTVQPGSSSTWTSVLSANWIVKDAGTEVKSVTLVADTTLTISETEPPVVDASVTCDLR